MKVSIYTDAKETLYRVMKQISANTKYEKRQYIFNQIVDSVVLESDIILVYESYSKLSELAKMCSLQMDNRLLVITCFMENDDDIFSHNTLVLNIVERNCDMRTPIRRPIVIFDSDRDADQIIMEAIDLAESLWSDMQKCPRPQVYWIHPDETSCRMVLLDNQGIMVKVH